MNPTSGHPKQPSADAGARESPDAPPQPKRRTWWAGWLGWSAALLTVALAITFALPPGVTLGADHTDLVGQFIAWRGFAADRLRAGDFPFWNPYVFSGQPFLGGFQSALLYPPNVVFLALPLARALTFSIVLHLALLGAGTAWWARRRGVSAGVAAAVGCATALSGVVFPHVYAGHLSNLCTMTWAPWAFAGFEMWWRDRRPAGLLQASAAICLQVLAGQMQYVFFLAVAAGIQALMATALEPAARRRALPGLIVGGAAAALLAAAQFLPGIEAAAESVRQGRLDYDFASLFALPPENLLTAIVPGFFGDTQAGLHPYWGRCYIWEMSVHLGVFAVWCALVSPWDRRLGRLARGDLLVAGILMVLALGRHLPLYDLLYSHVPGFAQFRGFSKFSFPALLFVMMAAAAGLDALVDGRWAARRIGFAILGGTIVLGGAALVVWLQPGIVRRIFEWMLTDPHPDLRIAPPKFPTGAEAHAAAALARAAAWSLLAAVAVWAVGRWRAGRWCAVLLLPAEALVFAGSQFATVATSVAMPAALSEFVAARRGDYRVLNLTRPNNGYLLGAADLWGNDPGVLKRYAELMTFTQGGNPDAATQNLAFAQIPPLYAMFRCGYAFVPTNEGVTVVEVPNPLPRALLVSEYHVASGRDAAFAALTAGSFDPRRSVVLEREPKPAPQSGGSNGKVKIESRDVDSHMIEAELTAPALLLITEPYSKGWQARALPGSAQSTYDVLVANYVLQAVPLAAGRHRFELEYRPRTWAAGAGISIAAWLGWFAAVWAVRRGVRARLQPPATDRELSDTRVV